MPSIVTLGTQIPTLTWVQRRGETARAMLCRDLLNLIADVPKLNGSPVAHAHPALNAKLLAVQVPAAPTVRQTHASRVGHLVIDGSQGD
jgi:hypothetical protein